MSCYIIENAGKTTLKTDDYAFAIACSSKRSRKPSRTAKGLSARADFPFPSRPT